jgi:hypothetical protein
MASCQGTRDRHYCGAHLYRCKNCGNVGCQQNQAGTCIIQGFSGLGKCLACGETGTREALSVIREAPL